jgi:hypothetical protein
MGLGFFSSGGRTAEALRIAWTSARSSATCCSSASWTTGPASAVGLGGEVVDSGAATGGELGVAATEGALAGGALAGGATLGAGVATGGVGAGAWADARPAASSVATETPIARRTVVTNGTTEKLFQKCGVHERSRAIVRARRPMRQELEMRVRHD